MPRHKRNIGSITRKTNGRWYAEVSVQDPVCGRSKRVALGGFSTKDDAERAIAKVVTEMATGGFVMPDRTTLGAYLLRELASVDRRRHPADDHGCPRHGISPIGVGPNRAVDATTGPRPRRARHAVPIVRRETSVASLGEGACHLLGG